MITSSYPRATEDAAGHFVASEVEILRSQGHQVTVWAAGRGTASADPRVKFLGGSMLFDHPGAWPRLKAAPHRALGLLTASVALLRLGRARPKQPVDRVIAHWLFPSAIPWSLLATSPRVPLEVVVHGSDLTLALRLPSWLLSWLLSSLYSRPTRLRFVSEALRADLLAHNLSPEVTRLIDQSVVAASPFDLPEVPGQADARRRLRLDPEKRFAVVVGRLIKEKRIDTALRAAELVPELSTIVIGTGPLENELRRRFPAVRFLGQLSRSETLLWIRAVDFLLSTSRYEGAPTAVREAIQLKTPVVAVQSGDLAHFAKSIPDLHVI